MDRYLDAAPAGPCFLRIAQVAGAVEQALYHPDCEVHAYILMPNHVHALLTPHVALPKLMQSIKGRSARDANQILGSTGKPFWQPESYDHLVRNAGEFRKIQNYIENNPVKAGLAPDRESYRWSSAWFGWRKLQFAAAASVGAGR
jgi:REP-associated tyrosine transposase